MKSSKVISTKFLCCAILLAAIVGYQQIVGSVSRVLITEQVSESKLVTLAGNTRPEVMAANDRGPVATDFPMEHMLLQLRRAAEQEQALEKYINELTDPKSPNFHHWLTPQEIGERYGLAAQDLAIITNWLKSHDFTVNRIYPNGMVIDFSGTAGEVREAFHTEIHRLDVNGTLHVANMSDPQIPAALALVVVGVVSLNDFRPQPQYHVNPNYTFGCNNAPFSSACYSVVPADLATIYNLNPLFAAGLSGQGQTIVVIEDSDVYSLSDWSTFRSTFGLSGFSEGSVSQIHPGGCTDPGPVPEDEFEAILDAEWASAAAPSAAIVLASCAGGLLNAGENLLNSNGPLPAIMSISFGSAEAVQGAAANFAISMLYQMAAGEGVSVFVAAGDGGAATADAGESASLGISVNGLASTQYDVAVGGTDFGDTFAGTNSTYWSSTNGPNDASALSYVPEIPWNDSCANGLIASFLGFPSTFGSESVCNAGDGLDISAGGGGPSLCATGAPSTPDVVSGTCKGYQKPSWQSVQGNPNDGVRDLPDVSLFASNGPWGHSYVWCDSDPADNGGGCFTGGGGTSFATPIMAGIQSLVNQHTGSRQGNPNPTYYSLAAAEYGTTGSAACNSKLGNGVASTCIFYDVTQGDMDVPCTGTNNCYDPSGTYGVLSTSNSAFQPAYPATTGWDFATGIGTVNAYNLVMAFSTTGPTPTPTQTPTGSTPTPTPTSTPSPTPAPSPVAAQLEITPGKLNFKKVTVGNAKLLTLTLSNAANNGPPITFGNPTAFSVPVTSPQEFGFPQSGMTTCPSQLLPKQECKLTLQFAPASTGQKSSTVTIFDNASNAPQVIHLQGTGK